MMMTMCVYIYIVCVVCCINNVLCIYASIFLCYSYYAIITSTHQQSTAPLTIHTTEDDAIHRPHFDLVLVPELTVLKIVLKIMIDSRL